MVHRNPVVALAGHFFQPAFMCKVYRPVAIRDLKLQKIRWLDNYAKQREELQLPTLIHRLCPALRLRSGDGTSLSKGDYHNFRFITIIFYSSAALQMHCNAVQTVSLRHVSPSPVHRAATTAYTQRARAASFGPALRSTALAAAASPPLPSISLPLLATSRLGYFSAPVSLPISPCVSGPLTYLPKEPF